MDLLAARHDKIVKQGRVLRSETKAHGVEMVNNLVSLQTTRRISRPSGSTFDMMALLPMEILIEVFLYLDSAELLYLRRVSKLWYKKLDNPTMLSSALRKWQDLERQGQMFDESPNLPMDFRGHAALLQDVETMYRFKLGKPKKILSLHHLPPLDDQAVYGYGAATYNNGVLAYMSVEYRCPGGDWRQVLVLLFCRTGVVRTFNMRAMAKVLGICLSQTHCFVVMKNTPETMDVICVTLKMMIVQRQVLSPYSSLSVCESTGGTLALICQHSLTATYHLLIWSSIKNVLDNHEISDSPLQQTEQSSHLGLRIWINSRNEEVVLLSAPYGSKRESLAFSSIQYGSAANETESDTRVEAKRFKGCDPPPGEGINSSPSVLIGGGWLYDGDLARRTSPANGSYTFRTCDLCLKLDPGTASYSYRQASQQWSKPLHLINPGADYCIGSTYLDWKGIIYQATTSAANDGRVRVLHAVSPKIINDTGAAFTVGLPSAKPSLCGCMCARCSVLCGDERFIIALSDENGTTPDRAAGVVLLSFDPCWDLRKEEFEVIRREEDSGEENEDSGAGDE